jgi:hypothetical protein
MSKIQPYAEGYSQVEPLAGTLTLLSNASATGDAVAWSGGKGTVSASGTFGGAALTLQYLGPDGATWVNAGLLPTFTSAGVVNFEAAAGSIRMAVAGGSPSALFAKAVGYVS